MGWNVDRLIGELSLVHSYSREHFLEPFLELAMKDPEKATSELSDYIEKALDSGGGLFRGTMCGGPYPPVTGPFLNVAGLVYPHLDREKRTKALKECLKFLDGLNYMSSQENVEQINASWLVRDVLINRFLYWPGYAEYNDKLKEIAVWSDFENAFMITTEDGKKFKCRSTHFLGFAVSRMDSNCPDPIRERFAEEFPSITDGVKDFIAGWIHYKAFLGRDLDGTYKEIVIDKLRNYLPSWEEELRHKLSEEKWIMLPGTVEDIERYRKRQREEKGK